jgi:CPA2 family monovalent cation:H+ antiporter-2
MIVADAATLGNPRQSVLRPLLERVLSVVALVGLSLWLLAMLPSGWSLFGAAGGVLLLLLIVAGVFWRRFVKLQTRLEIRLLDRLHRASQVTSASAWSDTLPQQTADWNLEIDEVTLPVDSVHAGKTLRQTALRTTFGCSVLGIDRQGFGIVNPNSDTVLYPHDKLLLLGEHGHLVRAARELLRFAPPAELPTSFDELTMETIQVPEACPLAGRPLLELELIRKYGVQIGGIRRGARSTFSPGGKDHFEAGDELLLLGTHSQINEFSQHLAPAGRHPDNG